MRNSIDVLRSLQRWTALVLDDAYEVRLDTQITKPPMAVINQTTPETSNSGRWAVELSMGTRIAIYPGPQVTEELAVIAAGLIEELIFRGLRRGLAGSRALRVPLYDFDGVDPDDVTTVRETYDFIRISGLSVQPLYEPEDRKRVTVLVAFTSTWMRAGERPEIEIGPPNTGGVVVSPGP